MWRARLREALLLLAFAAGAVLLHGYHFGIEDQTLYLPAIEKALNPALFPHDSEFFLTQARYTGFDEGMAWILRTSHLQLDLAVFIGHIGALLLVLFACKRLARYAFHDSAAEWMGLALVIILLPLPVAGTRLGLMEQYFHPRGLAIGLVLFAFFAAIKQRPVAVFYLAIATVIHPLTGIWGIVHVAFQAGPRRWQLAVPLALALMLVCCSPLSSPPSDADTTYWRTALSPESFDLRYPIHWPWYEWAGVFPPLALLGYFFVSGRRRGAMAFAELTGRLCLSGSVGVLIALALTAAPDRRLPLQPMRELHLVYIVMFLFLGARVEQRYLKGRLVRRIVFVLPMIIVVALAQRHFPSSPHIEWPGQPPHNAWVEAFEWAGAHTPTDALFALDPFYMRRPGPDSHSFRAIAQRSTLAEAIHDLAPAAMSPALAVRWTQELHDQTGWIHFTSADFTRLKRQYGVAWVILNSPGVPGVPCVYTNGVVMVCQVE